MKASEFDFDLPDDRIALEPVRPRDSARLLHVAPDDFRDLHVTDLPALLRPRDLLVLNDTKVIPAQLRGRRPARNSGDERIVIEATLHKRELPGPSGEERWRAFVRPARRVNAGDIVEFAVGFSALVERRDGAEATFLFSLGGANFEAALARSGAPPLPPYIARKRPLRNEDRIDYQTLFATESGSVAAPTAGLHFTASLLRDLEVQGIEIEKVTLHVGAGTFLPVSADDIADHRMHAEWGEITPTQADRINHAREAGGRIVAVGTTSLRLLESAADDFGAVRPFRGETSIFITPGYRFRAVDRLMTNFHLPRSTLFMLVCAFSGLARMQEAYRHAIAARYRFYSFGDACFLEPAMALRA